MGGGESTSSERPPDGVAAGPSPNGTSSKLLAAVESTRETEPVAASTRLSIEIPANALAGQTWTNQPRGGATRAGATRLPPCPFPLLFGSAAGAPLAVLSLLGAVLSLLGAETVEAPVGAVVAAAGEGLGGAGSRGTESGGLDAGVGSTAGGATAGVGGGLTTGAVTASTASVAPAATSPTWATTPAPSSARLAPAGVAVAISPRAAAIAAARQRNRRGPGFVRLSNWVLPSCSVRTDWYPLSGRIFDLRRERLGFL